MVVKLRALYSFGERTSRYVGETFVVTVLVLILALLSFCFYPIIQNILEIHYATEQRIEGLRDLILNLGAAFISAMAIVISLVLFAMQVNIDRMSHELFLSFSMDAQLRRRLILVFLLPIIITVSSMLVDKGWLASAVFIAVWGIIFISILLMSIYRRTLRLINPMEQLNILTDRSQKEFQLWARRAKRTMPFMKIFRQEYGETIGQLHEDFTHDLARVDFFKVNRHWIDEPKKAIQNSMSFAQRYAERDDYKISEKALKVIAEINVAYIRAKGKTFYSGGALLMEDNDLVGDEFITFTLEELRKYIHIGIGRRDELQIEQALGAISLLVKIYLQIDYSAPYSDKSHSKLASNYLANAVEAVPPNMADVRMKGLSLMGQSAQFLLANGSDPAGISTIEGKIENITANACAGTVRENYHQAGATDVIRSLARSSLEKENYFHVAVAEAGMTQLAKLVIALIYSKMPNAGFAACGAHERGTKIVKSFLELGAGNIRMSSSYDMILSPYYDCTKETSLSAQLAILAMQISKVNSENAGIRAIIQNIELWAARLYDTEEKLLLVSIRTKSSFTSRIIRWIASVTRVLLVVSNAPACDSSSRDELHRRALWLITVLTKNCDDENTVTFVEKMGMTNVLFGSAIDAHHLECYEVAEYIGGLLLSWAFKGGECNSEILKKGLVGATVLAQQGEGEQVSELMAKIDSYLYSKSAPGQEIRNSAAREIYELVVNPQEVNRWILMGMRITESDRAQAGPILKRIAQVLSSSANS